MAAKTPEQIVNANWTFEPNANGHYTYEQIQASAALFAADQLRAIKWQLEAINRKLDALGADGIHTVIKELSIKANDRRRRRLDLKARKLAKVNGRTA